ncbi:internal scaffolding protein [Dipodfec virus RodF1_52]|uniref:Internal scaffolding protein n=1 Tax=Dipodfec virus RodF1_52 TaxID=2929301 RepID=A0A976N2Q2_9VIRU|nr:internal scaffolding protein [Dipodfec virus RodF1_52]
MFPTQYTKRPSIFSHPGSRIHVLYSPRFSKGGDFELVQTGEESLYAEIQSHALSCDINYIMARFAAGDKDILSQHQGFYADLSDIPSSYSEVLNSVIAGEHAFARLPVEVKQRFGNSFSQWLSSFDTPEWSQKMGFSSPDDAPSLVPAADPTPQPVPDLSAGGVTDDSQH